MTYSRKDRLTAFETCIGSDVVLPESTVRGNGALMTAHALQAEFAGFPASAAGEEGANPVSLYLALSYRHGGLIPQAMLPTALGVSNQRVSQLVNAGRFATHKIGSMTFITGESFEAFLIQERKAGFAPKAPTFSQMVHAVKDLVRDNAEDSKKRKKAA